MIVADPPPLEMGFVNDTRAHHDRIADLDRVLLVVHVERLLGKVQLTRTIRGRDGAKVGVADGEGVVFAQLEVYARIGIQERGWVGQAPH